MVHTRAISEVKGVWPDDVTTCGPVLIWRELVPETGWEVNSTYAHWHRELGWVPPEHTSHTYAYAHIHTSHTYTHTYTTHNHTHTSHTITNTYTTHIHTSYTHTPHTITHITPPHTHIHHTQSHTHIHHTPSHTYTHHTITHIHTSHTYIHHTITHIYTPYRHVQKHSLSTVLMKTCCCFFLITMKLEPNRSCMLACGWVGVVDKDGGWGWWVGMVGGDVSEFGC